MSVLWYVLVSSHIVGCQLRIIAQLPERRGVILQRRPCGPSQQAETDVLPGCKRRGGCPASEVNLVPGSSKLDLVVIAQAVRCRRRVFVITDQAGNTSREAGTPRRAGW